jgi:hypothetical protein
MVDNMVKNSINAYPPPYEAVGWPPGIQDFIRQVAHAAAMEIIENIYTQLELEDKAERIILSEDNHIK